MVENKLIFNNVQQNLNRIVCNFLSTKNVDLNRIIFNNEVCWNRPYSINFYQNSLKRDYSWKIIYSDSSETHEQTGVAGINNSSYTRYYQEKIGVELTTSNDHLLFPGKLTWGMAEGEWRSEGFETIDSSKSSKITKTINSLLFDVGIEAPEVLYRDTEFFNYGDFFEYWLQTPKEIAHITYVADCNLWNPTPINVIGIIFKNQILERYHYSIGIGNHEESDYGGRAKWNGIWSKVRNYKLHFRYLTGQPEPKEGELLYAVYGNQSGDWNQKNAENPRYSVFRYNSSNRHFELQK